MHAAQHAIRFDYQIAEEVVVRLEGITAFDLATCRELPPRALPPWTIADITARIDRDQVERYAIRFRHHHTTLIAAIPVGAIEGTA